MARIVSGVTLLMCMAPGYLPFETCYQFFRRYRRGTDFANDEAGSVIGNDSGFQWRSASGNGKRKGSDYSIACAGYIKDFFSDSGNMNGLLVPLAQQHPKL